MTSDNRVVLVATTEAPLVPSELLKQKSRQMYRLVPGRGCSDPEAVASGYMSQISIVQIGFRPKCPDKRRIGISEVWTNVASLYKYYIF